MSLNQIVNPLTDADFKSLKVNGSEVISSPALQLYTPTLTGTSITGFADVSGSFSKNGKFLTMRCQFKANVVAQPWYVQINVPLPPGETVKTGGYQFGSGSSGPDVVGDSIFVSSSKSSLPTSCSIYLSADKVPNTNGLFYWAIEFIVEVN